MTAPLDRRILFLATVGGLPAVLIAEYVIWRTAWPLPVRILLALALLGSWIGCAIAPDDRARSGDPLPWAVLALVLVFLQRRRRRAFDP